MQRKKSVSNGLTQSKFNRVPRRRTASRRQPPAKLVTLAHLNERIQSLRGPYEHRRPSTPGPFPAQHLPSGLLRLLAAQQDRDAQDDQKYAVPAHPPAALGQFWRSYGATERTWARWAEQPHATLAQLLALHHGLDPDQLRMEQGDLAFVRSLPARYAHIPGDPVGAFVGQLRALRGSPTQRMFWSTETRPGSDPWHWTMAVDVFQRIFSATAFARIGFEPDAPSPAARRPNTHTTRLWRVAEALREELRPREDGGSYVPGDWTTLIETEAFFDAHWPELGRAQRHWVRMLLRPEGLRGRQPRSCKYFPRKGQPTGPCTCRQCRQAR